MRPLDRIDITLLEALQKNARLSNKELAARVDLAPSSCLARVRRLLEDGYFRGFHGELDPAAVGVGLQALIAVRLARHAREEVASFERHALGLPEVVAVSHLAGKEDFLVQVAVRDAEHLRSLALDAFTTRSEVAHIETSLIYRHTRSPTLPIYAEAPEEEAGS